MVRRNEEPWGETAGYLNVRNFFCIRSLTPRQADGNALAIRFMMSSCKESDKCIKIKTDIFYYILYRFTLSFILYAGVAQWQSS